MRYGTGVALVAAAAVLWSLQGLIFRQIDDAGPWATLFWRSVGMMPVLLAFLAWRGRGRVLPGIRRAGMAGVLGGFGLCRGLRRRGLRDAGHDRRQRRVSLRRDPLPDRARRLDRAGRGRARQDMGLHRARHGRHLRDDQRRAGRPVSLAGNIAALIQCGGVRGLHRVPALARHRRTRWPTVLLGGIFRHRRGGGDDASCGHIACRAGCPMALWAMGMGRGPALRGNGALHAGQPSGSGGGSRASDDDRGDAGRPSGCGSRSARRRAARR